MHPASGKHLTAGGAGGALNLFRFTVKQAVISANTLKMQPDSLTPFLHCWCQRSFFLLFIVLPESCGHSFHLSWGHREEQTVSTVSRNNADETEWRGWDVTGGFVVTYLRHLYQGRLSSSIRGSIRRCDQIKFNSIWSCRHYLFNFWCILGFWRCN